MNDELLNEKLGDRKEEFLRSMYDLSCPDLVNKVIVTYPDNVSKQFSAYEWEIFGSRILANVQLKDIHIEFK